MSALRHGLRRFFSKISPFIAPLRSAISSSSNSYSPRRAALTHSSQWHNRLSHRCSPRLFFTTTLQDRLRDHHYRVEHALPCHPPTFRHLSRRTCEGHAGCSRPETSHANSVSRSYAGGRRHNTCGEGTGRSGERACERGAHSGIAESRAEGDARVCCGWVEGRVSVTGMYVWA